MKNSLLKGLMVFLTMLCTSLMHSQDVSGTVSDASGPLPGASILVKGTTIGAQTDIDGKYTIRNVGANAVLIFTYIGLKQQEVNVAGKTTINVVLKEDSAELQEVIVIGYGTVKKKDATGAVDQISSKDFDNVSATSPGELLRGKVSGVQVTATSGEPGAGVSIRIRGNSSIRSGNGPLIVIDGVPMDGGNVSSDGGDITDIGSSSARNPLNFINQNDIESMSILKDASSTAIYGSRGANGVIIITTKKGKSGVPQLSYSTSVQFSKRSGDFKLLSPDEFALAAPGQDKGSRSYDWEDAILQNGFSTNHDLSFSSSTESSNTRLSFGATSTDGIVKNTGIDKYTASFYNSNEFFDGILKIESRLMYAALKDQTTLVTNNAGYIGSLIGSALYWNPTLPVYQPDGSYTFVGDDYLNPVELLNAYKDYTNTQKLIASINTTIKLSNTLKYNFLFGIEQSNSSRKRQFLPTLKIRSAALHAVDDVNGGVDKYGYANISDLAKFNKTFEHNLTFNKGFSDNFNLNAILGFSYYDYNYEGNNSSGVGYSINQTNLIDNIEGGIAAKFQASSARNKVELQSYFARAEATLYKKLILNGTIRRDGSSKLGSNNKYDTFYAGGIAYKLIESEEGFLNDFKIRGNIGRTGNQEFAPNSALAKQSYQAGGSNNGAEQINQNKDLKWETTKSYGVGVDFELLNNRLTGSLDYFQRDTKDLIFPLRPAATQPGPNSNKFLNLEGNLINKGLEVALNYKVIDTDDLQWNVSANASFLSNELKDFPVDVNAGGVNGQGLSGAYAEVIKSGYPIYTYYMYEFKGYDASGNSLYTDAEGNEVGLGLASRHYLDKQPLPKMNLGFSTNLAYKNLDLTASFYGAFGHYIYNNTANAYFFKGALLGGRNVTPDIATSAQAQADPNSPSTKFLEKGDFLRLGNLTLGYTVKGSVIERLKMKSARFYVNADNLFVITNYSGFDPEVDTDKTLGGVPSAGMDYLSYPKSKSISVGLNVTF
ncbi:MULTISPECIES: SusC/RagA family TonB-linked outer membrane protein [unclassified Flavobacterium]|uniref:SusC/RagA family TonB-linked outer membrane protein n=1 Tax=unclassified Flavobacterium TaxID=196869 RepID=UPI003F8E5804